MDIELVVKDFFADNCWLYLAWWLCWQRVTTCSWVSQMPRPLLYIWLVLIRICRSIVPTVFHSTTTSPLYFNELRPHLSRSTSHRTRFDVLSVLDTTLLEWISEYTVWSYITPDVAVSYLNHAQIACITPSFAMWCPIAAESCKNSTSGSWVWIKKKYSLITHNLCVFAM